MDATSWATLYALLALVIFIAIVFYVKGPAMVAKSLDERAQRISNELGEARQLREDSPLGVFPFGVLLIDAGQHLIERVGEEAELVPP